MEHEGFAAALPGVSGEEEDFAGFLTREPSFRKSYPGLEPSAALAD
jgi:hypothetical protein